MKKTLAKILIFGLIISSIFAISASPVFAVDKPTGSAAQSNVENQGSSILSKFLAYTNLQDMVNSLMAMLANFAMSAAGTFLGFCAYIFDISMTLTLNIKDFVNATPAVFSTWRILRDITGLGFIFYLLYAAIQMMTGWGKGSYSSTLKNIIIAGIFVNFSFFITSVGIDASNVVSQAIYSAINPTHNVVSINADTGIKSLVASDTKAKISDIFMNSLKIQTIYDINGNKLGANLGDPIKIALIGLAGVVMMFTTGMSFLLASVAVMARTVILIFLLAFSSLYWAGIVLPEIKKYSGKLLGQLNAQLIFLPTYLLLMYVGLSIINGSQLLGAGKIINDASMNGTNWLLPYILIATNFAIVIAILNLPLVVALSMGGLATDILGKYGGKFNALSIWKNIGTKAWNNTGALAGQNIIGGGANKLKDSKLFGKIASSSPLIGTAISKGLNNVSSATFGGTKGGYDAALKKQKGDLEKLYKDLEKNKFKSTVGDKELNAQDVYRQSLNTSILGKVFAGRASRETAEKLTKEFEKKTNKKNKKTNQVKLSELKAKLAGLSTSSSRPGFASGTESDEERAKRESLISETKKEIEDLEKKIEDAEESDKSDRDKKLLDEIKSSIEPKDK